VTLSRTFTLLAAVLLVFAFALMILPPPTMSLAQGLSELNHALVMQAQHAVQRALGSWAWMRVCVPVLVRPVWLMPLCLGLLCAGTAASTAPPSQPPHGARTRS
jgi:hypothetical protein